MKQNKMLIDIKFKIIDITSICLNIFQKLFDAP